MRSLAISAALVRASLMTAMQYRADFVFDGVAGLFRALSIVLPVLVVYGHRDTVAGWGVWDATLVMGLFLLMQAVLGGLVEPNMGEVVEAIRTGTLDLVLLKPADSQLLVSLRRVEPSRLWNVLGGAIVAGAALARMPPPSLLDVSVAVVLGLCGCVAMYSLWVLAICTSFFFVRVDNLRFLLWSIMDAGRWPLPMFAGWVQFTLTAVIPVGLLTTFPALALRGQWDARLVAIAVGVSLLFAVGSRLAWTRSIRYYTSASS